MPAPNESTPDEPILHPCADPKTVKKITIERMIIGTIDAAINIAIESLDGQVFQLTISCPGPSNPIIQCVDQLITLMEQSRTEEINV